MGVIASLAGGLVGNLLGKALGKKKQQDVQQPVAQPTRNEAEEQARGRDLMARRRGTLANAVLGARGAEANVGSKTKLGT